MTSLMYCIGTDFFRQRIKQLLSLMFQFDKKHLAAARLHPQYRKLTFIDDYKRSKIHIYVRQLLVQLETDGISAEQLHSKTNAPEPAKKKHKSIEDQFVDPEGSSDGMCVSIQSSTSQKKL